MTESALRSRLTGELMCKTCDNFERRIEQFRRLMTPDMDKLSLGLMRSWADALEAEKAAFKCSDSSKR